MFLKPYIKLTKSFLKYFTLQVISDQKATREQATILIQVF